MRKKADRVSDSAPIRSRFNDRQLARSTRPRETKGMRHWADTRDARAKREMETRGLRRLSCRGCPSCRTGQLARQYLDNTLGRAAVPEQRALPRLAAAANRLVGFRNDSRRVCADEHVGALIDRDGALGVFANGDARHAQRGGFFLQAAAVGLYDDRILPQTQKGHVGLRSQ